MLVVEVDGDFWSTNVNWSSLSSRTKTWKMLRLMMVLFLDEILNQVCLRMFWECIAVAQADLIMERNIYHYSSKHMKNNMKIWFMYPGCPMWAVADDCSNKFTLIIRQRPYAKFKTSLNKSYWDRRCIGFITKFCWAFLADVCLQCGNIVHAVRCGCSYYTLSVKRSR